MTTAMAICAGLRLPLQTTGGSQARRKINAANLQAAAPHLESTTRIRGLAAPNNDNGASTQAGTGMDEDGLDLHVTKS